MTNPYAKNDCIEEVGSPDNPLSWDSFKQEIQKDIEENNRIQKDDDMHYSYIYRGQSNATWRLETSLERYLETSPPTEPFSYPAKEYYLKIRSIIPAINSLTEHKFEGFNPYSTGINVLGPLPQYEILCYLRHHGFPTPMLDWTQSYYVAAYFAYSGVNRKQRTAQNARISIYAYKHWNGEGHRIQADIPSIQELGPYVQTHPRHYAQQSRYTVCRCTKTVQGINEIWFCNHEEAIKQSNNQHKMKKFILDASESDHVLKELQTMNINEYTLLGDESALLKTLAYKEFIGNPEAFRTDKLLSA